MPKKIPPALAKFQKRVKQIQRATGKSFRSAQKQASAERKGKKVSGVKKKSSSKSRSPSGSRMGAMTGPESLSSAISNVKKVMTAKLGWALASQRTARTQKEKRALQPLINELTTKLRALNR